PLRLSCLWGGRDGHPRGTKVAEEKRNTTLRCGGLARFAGDSLTDVVASGRGDKSLEQRVRRCRLRLEFWMKLHGQEPGVAIQFDDLHKAAVRVRTGHAHPVLGKRLPVGVVKLVAMPMPLRDLLALITGRRDTSGLQSARLGA